MLLSCAYHRCCHKKCPFVAQEPCLLSCRLLRCLQVLHDAFFKHQTKPNFSGMGDLYYEGKEFEARVRPLSLPLNVTVELSSPPIAPSGTSRPSSEPTQAPSMLLACAEGLRCVRSEAELQAAHLRVAFSLRVLPRLLVDNIPLAEGSGGHLPDRHGCSALYQSRACTCARRCATRSRAC